MSLPSTDPSALANAATCFNCVIPIGDQLAVQTYLLTLLAAAGAGGTTQGAGAPSGAPLGNNGLYYDNVSFILYIWNSRLAHWDQLIGP